MKPPSVEITNVSKHGFWIFVDGRELFAAFENFPWFEKASIADLLAVERSGPDHLYWPTLDIDLSIRSIEHPEEFPLTSRASSARPRKPKSVSAARSAATRKRSAGSTRKKARAR